MCSHQLSRVSDPFQFSGPFLSFWVMYLLLRLHHLSDLVLTEICSIFLHTLPQSQQSLMFFADRFLFWRYSFLCITAFPLNNYHAAFFLAFFWTQIALWHQKKNAWTSPALFSVRSAVAQIMRQTGVESLANLLIKCVMCIGVCFVQYFDMKSARSRFIIILLLSGRCYVKPVMLFRHVVVRTSYGLQASE